MAWAHVQSKGASGDTNVDNIAVTLDANTTAGNLLVIAISFDSSTGTGASVPTLTGGGVGTVSQVGTTINDTNSQAMLVLYSQNITGGAATITATWADGKQFRRIVVSEYSGIATTGALITSNQRASYTATTATDNATTNPNQATPTATGQLIVSPICVTNQIETYTAGTNFTKRIQDPSTTGANVGMEDRSAPSTSAQDATWTINVATTLHANQYIAIFAEAVAGWPPAGTDDAPEKLRIITSPRLG